MTARAAAAIGKPGHANPQIKREALGRTTTDTHDGLSHVLSESVAD